MYPANSIGYWLLIMGAHLRVAACHATPIFLSARKTTDKAISLINRAASNDVCNHDLFRRTAIESGNAARKNRTIVSVGISEKVGHNNGCLYNSNLIIDSDGEVLIHYRKLVATFFEKLPWSHGDGYSLEVADTAVGKIGALISDEDSNPLARYSLMAQGERHSSDSSVHFQGSDNVLGHHRYSTERAHRHFQDRREGIFDFLQQGEGVLHKDMDSEDCIKDNQYHDGVDGYQGLGVFDLKVDRTRTTPNTFVTNRED
ncbi:putative CN hydrolase domain-containing protein [Seiridium cardinale]|uniref:CN hydrolase domain-containing protein n=1 Tax=Seiridium cardinale TaxID=138064 RepID=A0ABR2X7S4_9PEZI